MSEERRSHERGQLYTAVTRRTDEQGNPLRGEAFNTALNEATAHLGGRNGTYRDYQEARIPGMRERREEMERGRATSRRAQTEAEAQISRLAAPENIRAALRRESEAITQGEERYRGRTMPRRIRQALDQRSNNLTDALERWRGIDVEGEQVAPE